jgi:hypothetical protein
MRPQTLGFARAWLPYLLAGILWITYGSVALGEPQGLGLIFTGLACLAIGLYGARWRMRHRYQPSHHPQRRAD